MKKLVWITLVLMMTGCVWGRYQQRHVEVEFKGEGVKHDQGHGNDSYEHGDQGDGRHGKDDHH